jgi:hypothetical protein
VRGRGAVGQDVGFSGGYLVGFGDRARDLHDIDDADNTSL